MRALKTAATILLVATATSEMAFAVQFGYDDNHHLKTADYGNGLVIQYDYDAAGNRNSRIVQSPYSAQPQIVVQDNGSTPATTLSNGTSTVAFGNVSARQNTVRTFTLSNLGISALGNLAVTVDGTNASDFTVTQPAATSLSTNATTTFSVRFAPTTPSSKTASLHIASNDPNHGSFTVSLTGTCPPLINSWRQTYFGTTANTGMAADNAMPQHDGIANLMKFATGMNPTVPGSDPTSQVITANNILYTYPRNKAAVTDGVTFSVEWSDDLVTWNTTGVTEAAVDQGTAELVTATVPRGSGTRRFVHLRVTH